MNIYVSILNNFAGRIYNKLKVSNSNAKVRKTCSIDIDQGGIDHRSWS